MVIVTQGTQNNKTVFGIFASYAEAFEAAMDNHSEALGNFNFHHVPKGEQRKHEMPFLQQAA